MAEAIVGFGQGTTYNNNQMVILNYSKNGSTRKRKIENFVTGII